MRQKVGLRQRGESRLIIHVDRAVRRGSGRTTSSAATTRRTVASVATTATATASGRAIKVWIDFDEYFFFLLGTRFVGRFTLERHWEVSYRKLGTRPEIITLPTKYEFPSSSFLRGTTSFQMLSSTPSFAFLGPSNLGMPSISFFWARY